MIADVANLVRNVHIQTLPSLSHDCLPVHSKNCGYLTNYWTNYVDKSRLKCFLFS